MAKALDQLSLYDTDYVAWLAEQVARLRAGRLAALDVANVAEELESLMKSERHRLENRLEVLLLHMLKWTINRTRDRIAGVRPSKSSAGASGVCYATAPVSNAKSGRCVRVSSPMRSVPRSSRPA